MDFSAGLVCFTQMGDDEQEWQSEPDVANRTGGSP